MTLTSLNTKRHAAVSFTSGKGAILHATDGREYLDFSSSYGPIVLGYCHEAVGEAVTAQLARGVLFPWASPEVDALSAQLLAHFPNSQECLFFKSGSEAVAAAVRLARAQTGRTQMIRAGFHGWHDQVISPFYRWHEPDGPSLEGNSVPGVPPALAGHWSAWDGRDLRALERLVESPPPAAVIVDPVMFEDDVATNLRAVCDLAHKYGGLVILDEVKTGFRTALGGVQQLSGVAADLTVVSKALGNGFPIAAVVCSEETARLAAVAKVKGTYNSELISIAAATATLRVLSQERAPARLHQTGSRLIERFNETVELRGLQDSVRAIPYRWPCMPHIAFRGADRRQHSEEFSSELLREGIVWLPNHMNYVSLAHTEEHIERFIEAADKVLPAIARGG